MTQPDLPGTGAVACGYHDPTGIDSEDTDVAGPALRHLADAAVYACGAVGRNGFYPPELAVATLCTTVAAAAGIADHAAGYAGDFWPAAGRDVDAAHKLLIQARGLLDSARHRTTLEPPDSTIADQPVNRPEPTHRNDTAPDTDTGPTEPPVATHTV
jgi:hypothetical protein